MLPTARRPAQSPEIEAEVVASWKPTPTTYAIRLTKPKDFHFRPVQFTFLGLRTEQGVEWRPMSLATSPTREQLEYAVRRSDSAFKHAFSELKPGNRSWIRGPFGEFFLNETRPAVLIAGGIGITPLKGMAEYATDRELPIPVRLLYSSRSVEEIAYRSELEVLAERNPRFRVVHTLTGSVPDNWTGATGRISARTLDACVSGLSNPLYYVCGAPQFVQDQLAMLGRRGVPESDLDWELFRGY